ncbi:fumble-domain-containing protein [Sporormia fimetaria CBS 119925]|uniref:Fumble-domain-containing protein n=1 Tax=Sporormia fimetaria CBS 119925 TaxID=1340428 RepID=A0A6A6VBH8_9PLEO|nr:fumble-domain-containing protein [Sporormia fimetaria CBS 119925]
MEPALSSSTSLAPGVNTHPTSFIPIPAPRPHARTRRPSIQRRRSARLPRPRPQLSSAAAMDQPSTTSAPKRQSRSRRRQQHVAQAPSVDDTILNPGTVRINATGAQIEEHEEEEPLTPRSDDYEHDKMDILLPNHRGIVSHIAIDIGGTLAKLIYFARDTNNSVGGRLNFMKFETGKIDVCIDIMRKLKERYQKQDESSPEGLCVMATGGGAFKYYDRIKEALGVEVIREDEMECLIYGLDFFISEIPAEIFTYNIDAAPGEDPITYLHDPPTEIYPYLLVNIGSGVSMIKVSGPRQFERIGGTSLGGGTFWGLLSLLTGGRNFDEMLKLAERGDNSTVDLLVGDIYGAAYNKIGLKSTHIASSFGKVLKAKSRAEQDAEDGCNTNLSHSVPENPPFHRTASAPAAEDDASVSSATSSPTPSSPTQSESVPSDDPTLTSTASLFRPEDISRSLLYMVSNNIGQIAHLHAEKHSLPRIYFGGSFIGGHSQTMHTLSYAIRFWSKGERQAYFLRHEGYLGAVGAFVKRQPRNWGRRASLERCEGVSWKAEMRA